MPFPKFARLILALTFAFVPFVAAQEAPGSASTGDAGVHIIILHTNDMHGQVLPMRVSNPKPGESAEIGGFAVLSAAIAKERAEGEASGAGVLLVDAGDFFQGTPEGDVTKGRLVLDLMKSMKYDLITLGNHEFDIGQENLIGLLKGSECPILSANLHQPDDRAYFPGTVPYVIREVNGIKIGFIGVILSDLHAVTSKKSTEGLIVRDEIATILAFLPELSRAGADIVIPVTHCGFDRDQLIAAGLTGVPIIIGGHSHTPVNPVYQNPLTKVKVTQAGSKTRFLGRADLRIDRATRTVISCADELLPVTRENWGEDAAMKERIAASTEEIQKEMGKVVGEAAADLTTQPAAEGVISSTLGNWVTDVMRKATDSEIAFTNRTGIRSSLLKGPLTRRDLYQASPFGNTMVTMQLSGDEILQTLEFALREGSRYLLEVSGMTVTVDLTRPVGQRVIEARVGDALIDPAKAYRVCTNSFVAQGGDDYKIFTKGCHVEDTCITVLDATLQAVHEASPLTPDPAGRFRQSR